MITHTTILWSGFILFVLAMLAIDLGLFQRKRHVMTLKEALIWFGVWVGLAMIFNLGVFLFHPRGAEAGLEYFAGYLIEKSLSVDNIFVFVLVFSYFNVPRISQHKVLMWGVLGALVFRAIFIVGGLALMQRFHWMMYLFGGFLLVTGLRMMLKKHDEEVDPQKSWAIRTFQKFMPITTKYDRDRFFTRENGKLVATPLLLALIAIESSDIVFAVDSIPAIFAVTPDPFIVFSSNIFAMLGLRSLYFAVSGVLAQFYFLRYGFASILLILSGKMLLSDIVKMPIAVSLVLIVFILLLCVIISLLRPRKADLKGVFARTARLGLIPFRRLLVIENILDHGDDPVRTIMRPRESISAVRLNAPWDENLRVLREHRFSRYPIIDGSEAKPLGVLHVADLVALDLTQSLDATRVKELARAGLELREDLRLTDALSRFRRHANDMGLVVDEAGRWTGIVTLEDLMEQMIGEIDDASYPFSESLFSIADALSPGRVVLDLQADSFNHAVENIISAIPQAELPADRQTILRTLLQRAAKTPTYLGEGVAVPHAQIEGLDKPILAFARSPEGVELSGNQHVELFFLALCPKQAAKLEGPLIASIARLIDSEYMLNHLREAQTAEEVIETIRTAEQVLPVVEAKAGSPQEQS